MKKIMLIMVLLFAVAGCASTGQQNGKLGGAAAGGALGAIIGNAVDCKGCALIGGLMGAVAGGYVGGEIGKRMDAQDAARMNNTINTTPTGQTIAWSNPDTGIRYDVTPTRTYREPRSADFCREVTIGQAEVGGKRQEVYGTACRKPDGSWKMK